MSIQNKMSVPVEVILTLALSDLKYRVTQKTGTSKKEIEQQQIEN